MNCAKPAYGVAQPPRRPRARAGRQGRGPVCVTARPAPRPPARPNSTPREGGADKGWGPPAWPRPARPARIRSRTRVLAALETQDRPRPILQAAAAAVAKGGDARGSATRAADGTQRHRPSGAPSPGPSPAPRPGRARSPLKEKRVPSPPPEGAPRSRRDLGAPHGFWISISSSAAGTFSRRTRAAPRPRVPGGPGIREAHSPCPGGAARIGGARRPQAPSARRGWSRSPAAPGAAGAGPPAAPASWARRPRRRP